MKFVIAPDSFKGSLTAKQAAEAIQIGLKRVFPKADYELVPMADGGEGTVQALVDATKGEFLQAKVLNPFGQEVNARYGFLGDGQTAVIEVAAASGIQYIQQSEQNPMTASTYGTGQLMLDAIHHGAKSIIMGLGGSATVDGGQGMAEALGVQFLDAKGQPVARGGQGLGKIVTIDCTKMDPGVKQLKVKAASDVVNPLVGPKGAAKVFGPQKGATAEMIPKLDRNLIHYAAIIQKTLKKNIAYYPGGGAAGGLGAGLLAFTDAEIEKGVDIVVAQTHLKEKAQNVDYVFTGEGTIDAQTQYGKTPMGTAMAVKAVSPDAKVIGIAGNVGEGIDQLYDLGIDAIFGMLPGVMDLSTAIADAKENLAQTAENIARVLR